MRRPQASRPNLWIGFLGVLAYGIVTAAFLWALAALAFSMQP